MLQQIVYVVGTIWVGTAAKLGHSQLVFWLAAMLFFYLPQAAVVIHLCEADAARGRPLSVGASRLGELTGFLVAWNLWMYAVVLISTIGLVVGNESVVRRWAERRVAGEQQDVHPVARTRSCSRALMVLAAAGSA